MKKIVILFVFVFAGIAAWGQTRRYTNPCNGKSISLPTSRGSVYFIEKTLKEWKANGMWNKGVVLTDELARQLPAGDYYISENEKKYFEPEILGLYGPHAAWEYYTGKRTSFSEFCSIDALPGIKSKVSRQAAGLNCLDLPPMWTLQGDDVVVSICGRTYRYKKDDKQCKCTEVITETQSICAGQKLDWRGSSYDLAGTYKKLVKSDSVDVCDTLYILNLDISPLVQQSEQKTIPEGDSLLFDGEYRTTSGKYTRITPSRTTGCDTLTTLFLVVEKKCDPCANFRSKQLRRHWIGAEVYGLHEFALDQSWTEKLALLRYGLFGRYQFKNGFIFRKNPCVVEYLGLSVTAGQANIPLVAPGGCLDCDNLPSADRQFVDVFLSYGMDTRVLNDNTTVGAFTVPFARVQRVENNPMIHYGGRFGVEARRYFLGDIASVFGRASVDYLSGVHYWMGGFQFGVALGPVKNKKR